MTAGWALRPVAVLAAGTLFMENLDATIVATAAPSIGRSFGVTSAQVGVTATAYLATVAALIPVSAWMAGRFGARTVFLGAIAVFTAASALCALSTGLTELALLRVAQGAGGAMMVPVGRLVVLRGTGKADIIRAIAYLTWPALLAPVIAPAVGGLLTTYASWQWIFLINLPLGVVAFVAALRLMPHQTHSAADRLDWPGLLGTAGSLGCLVVLAALLGSPVVPTGTVLLLTAVTVGLGAWVTRHLISTRQPLLRLDALRVLTFRAAQGGGTLFRVGINGVPFVLPLLFQDRFGWTPARSGAMVLFLFLGNVVIKPVTTPLLKAVPFRPVLVVTTAGAAASVLACATLTATTSFALIVVILALSGVLRSIGYTCYNTITFADIDQVSMSHANTLAATIQQLTQALGVALAVLSLKVGTDTVGAGQAFRFAFVVLGLVIAAATLAAAMLPARAGDALRGGAAG